MTRSELTRLSSAGPGLAPNNTDAEQAVLGSLLIDPHAIERVAAILTPDHFYLPNHAAIYRAIVELHQEGTPADLVTLHDRLEQSGRLDDAGGFAYIAALPNSAPTSVNVEHYARIVEDQWGKRALMAVGQRIANGAEIDDIQRDLDALLSLRSADRASRNGHGSATQERIRRRNLSAIEARPVAWLWQPYIARGKLTLLDGDPGLGKSLLATAIASCLSVGGTLPGMREPMAAGKTMYLAGEDDPHDTLRPRFDGMGARLSMIEVIDAVMRGDEESGLILDPDGLGLLRHDIAEVRPTLVIVDPLVAFLGSRIDMHRANEVRAMMNPLRAMAQEFECAIVLIRHLRKALEGQAMYRGVGSIDFMALVRSALLVTVDPEDEDLRVVAQQKSNLAKKGSSLLFSLSNGEFRWAGTTELTADQLAAPRRAPRPPTKEEAAMEWLLEHHATKERPSDEIIREAVIAGHAEHTLRRAFGLLRGHAEPVRDDKGRVKSWVWLPFVKSSTHPDGQVLLRFGHLDKNGSSAQNYPDGQNHLVLGHLDGEAAIEEDEREYRHKGEGACPVCGSANGYRQELGAWSGSWYCRDCVMIRRPEPVVPAGHAAVDDEEEGEL